MPTERDQTDAISHLLLAARRFFQFATSSQPDEPDRLLKLIRLLDALNAAVIEIRSPSPECTVAYEQDWSARLRDRWPELVMCYPTALQSEQEWLEGDREADLAFALDDLADICHEIDSSLHIPHQPSAASHLAWSYRSHWHWHAHGLRGCLAEKLLHLGNR